MVSDSIVLFWNERDNIRRFKNYVAVDRNLQGLKMIFYLYIHKHAFCRIK